MKDRTLADSGITFINVFEVPVGQLDDFIEQWQERAQLMREAPGFRDLRLHRAISPDARFQLVNVARWDSAEACEAAGGNPAVVASVESARQVADANPALYHVVAEYP